MKNKRITAILLLGLSLLILPGCRNNREASPSSGVSVVSPSVISVSEDLPVSVNENITTSSNYYEEAEPATGSEDAEGFIPEELPEGTIHEVQTGEEFTFTENSTAAYAVVIDQAEFTDRRSVVPGDDAEQVLLITYTYRSLNGEPRLVDDMSFRLYTGDTAQSAYYVANQINGDISTDAAITAEVSFSVPAEASDFTLYVVDNAEENNENYQLKIQL